MCLPHADVWRYQHEQFEIKPARPRLKPAYHRLPSDYVDLLLHLAIVRLLLLARLHQHGSRHNIVFEDGSSHNCLGQCGSCVHKGVEGSKGYRRAVLEHVSSSWLFTTSTTCAHMSQHILYCNDNADILVLDLPASIARAQASTRQLRSTPALESPFSTPEPKGTKREELLAAVPADESKFHLDIQMVLLSALRNVDEHWHANTWCHPRVHIDQGQTSADHICLSHNDNHVDQSGSPPPLVLSPTLNNVCCLHDVFGTVVYNPSSSPTNFAISTHGRFTIPPQSVFLNASIENGIHAFVDAIHCLLPRRTFDLILLDPPWPNRSVRNSRVYRTAEHQLSDPFGQIITLVGSYLSEGGYVAVWITNKSKVRSTVLEQCCSRGLVLEEEWIWLKVTSKGDPVTPLDGLWKKPYELLLLFRRGSKQQAVTRRVGIAVPDVHSRKPSLKSMFEQLLPKQYNALEVFARSLTAGWWSWGDEVLKFQHESHWC